MNSQTFKFPAKRKLRNQQSSKNNYVLRRKLAILNFCRLSTTAPIATCKAARLRERRQSHKCIWLTSKIYDWRATWSRLGETKWLAATSRVNDWRRGGVQWLLRNCPMHEWHQSLHRFSYLVLFICNDCVYYCIQSLMKIGLLYCLCISVMTES